MRGFPAAAPLGADLLEQLRLAAEVVRVVLGEPVVAAAGLARAQFEAARGDDPEVPGQGVPRVLGADVDQQDLGTPQVGVEVVELLPGDVLGPVGGADAPADLHQPVGEQAPGQRIAREAFRRLSQEDLGAVRLGDDPAGEGSVVLVVESVEGRRDGGPVLASDGGAQGGEGGYAVGGFEHGPTGRGMCGHARIIWTGVDPVDRDSRSATHRSCLLSAPSAAGAAVAGLPAGP
ncbi:hypothetical protein, partial [Streptomyces erythrochromogenes]|uniref:hypothetical protein n=1 Tax=Streptomyces erythrochromogenes TaxID=285574 RepID=UPI0036A5478B